MHRVINICASVTALRRSSRARRRNNCILKDAIIARRISCILEKAGASNAQCHRLPPRCSLRSRRGKDSRTPQFVDGGSVANTLSKCASGRRSAYSYRRLAQSSRHVCSLPVHVYACAPRAELNVGGCPGAVCLCTCMSLCAPRAQLNVCAWVPVQGTMVFLGFRHHAGSIKELADKWDTSNSIFTFNSILVTLPLNCAVNWCA